MKCPRCQIALHLEIIKERSGPIEIDTCEQCHGIWFDQGELNELEKITKPVLIEFRKIPNEYHQLTALDCPKCDVHPRMAKVEHPKDENVIMDVCEQCSGIWLDGGELAAIQNENWFLAMFKLLKKMS